MYVESHDYKCHVLVKSYITKRAQLLDNEQVWCHYCVNLCVFQEEFSYPTTMMHDDMQQVPPPHQQALAGTLQYHRDTLSSDYRSSAFNPHPSLPNHYRLICCHSFLCATIMLHEIVALHLVFTFICSQVIRPRVGSINTTLTRTRLPSWSDNSHIYGTIDSSRLGKSLYRTSNA